MHQFKANLLMQLSRSKEVEAICSQFEEIANQKLGSMSPVTEQFTILRGISLGQLNRVPEAREVFRSGANRSKTQNGEHTLISLNFTLKYAESFLFVGDEEGAELPLSQVYVGYKEILGPQSRDYHGALNIYIWCLIRLEKFDRAVRLAKQGLTELTDQVRDKDRMRFLRKIAMSEAYLQMDEFEVARTLAEEVTEIKDPDVYKQVRKLDGNYEALAFSILALCDLEAGNISAAKQRMLQAKSKISMRTATPFNRWIFPCLGERLSEVESQAD